MLFLLVIHLKCVEIIPQALILEFSHSSSRVARFESQIRGGVWPAPPLAPCPSII